MFVFCASLTNMGGRWRGGIPASVVFLTQEHENDPKFPHTEQGDSSTVVVNSDAFFFRIATTMIGASQEFNKSAFITQQRSKDLQIC